MAEEIDGLSLKPLPMEQWEILPQRERDLQCIGDVVAYWLKWITRDCEADGLIVDPDTYLILPGDNAPPHWPSVRVLSNWLKVIRAGATETPTAV